MLQIKNITGENLLNDTNMSLRLGEKAKCYKISLYGAKGGVMD